MDDILLKQINAMRQEMIRMVEQGSSIQDSVVIEKSQALDILIAAYIQQQSGCAMQG